MKSLVLAALGVLAAVVVLMFVFAPVFNTLISQLSALQ
jgi:FtsH-binding integral membrane protein